MLSLVCANQWPVQVNVHWSVNDDKWFLWEMFAVLLWEWQRDQSRESISWVFKRNTITASSGLAPNDKIFPVLSQSHQPNEPANDFWHYSPPNCTCVYINIFANANVLLFVQLWTPESSEESSEDRFGQWEEHAKRESSSCQVKYWIQTFIFKTNEKNSVINLTSFPRVWSE